MSATGTRPPGLLPALSAGQAAIEVAGQQLAGAELTEAVGGLARGLAGVGQVGVVAHPNLATLVSVAAVLATGGTAVPLHPQAGPAERAHVLRDAAVDLVLDNPGLTARGPLPAGPPADERPALILYTSGSTGPPKGAVIPRRAIAANLDTVAGLWQWSDSDVLAHALPFFHVHGLVFGGLGPLRLGSRLIHSGPYFKPAPGASMYFGVPALWASLSTADLRAMRPARLLVSGAGGLPGRLFDRVEQVCGQRLLNRYAMTETLIITSPRLGDVRSPRSVGPPLPGVQVRLTGSDGPPGPDGSPVREVEIRSPGLFSGYLGRDPVLDPDGWFRTGDLGTWAEDGSLRLLGRKDTDLIKTGGYRVGAGEVEDAVLAHPGVADVAVAGVPDHKLGQRVVAWVVAASPLDQAEMQSFLAARLAPYKRPLEIHLVDSLPRNALGKVQKRQLHQPIAVSDAREGR